MYSSPFRKTTVRPNRIINILDEIKPDIDALNLAFEQFNFLEVINIYERLKKTYSHLEIDITKIAYSYMKLGRNIDAELYLLELKDWFFQHPEMSQQQVLAEADRILEQIRKSVTSFHLYLEPLRPFSQCSLSDSHLRLSSFLSLMKITLEIDKEEAEYYSWMAIQQMDKSNVKIVEFKSFLHYVSEKVELQTPRILKQIEQINSELSGYIPVASKVLIDKILLTEPEIESPISLNKHIGEIRQELAYASNQLMQSIYQSLLKEEPTFAISMS